MVKSVFGKLLIAITLASLSTMVHANAWTVTIKDDLFSDTGKQAILIGFNRDPISFMAICNSKSFSYHILFAQKASIDETANTYNDDATYAIKVDEQAPYIEQSVLQRRNANFLHTGQSKTKPTEEEVAMLKTIGAAKKRIILGIDAAGQQFNTTLSASGSTEAVKTFLSTCSYL